MKHKTFNEEMQEMFGGKVYKLTLSTGCSCPNRDGTLSTGGCIFCSEGGSGDFAQKPVPVDQQIEEAKKLVEKKLSRSFAGYMAYFQPFSNTYGDPSVLRRIFLNAAERNDIVALSIGTRPDCLSGPILEVLTEIQQKKPLYVELGLQTSNEKTADFINRGFPNRVFTEAAQNLKARGIHVVVHIIAGLPGETDEDVLETVRFLADRKDLIDGIKIQVLQVLRGTRLYDLYRENPEIIHEYSLTEYAELLAKILAVLPENITIHRLTGDPPKNLLIAPQWTAQKKHVLNTLRLYTENR